MHGAACVRAGRAAARRAAGSVQSLFPPPLTTTSKTRARRAVIKPCPPHCSNRGGATPSDVDPSAAQAAQQCGSQQRASCARRKTCSTSGTLSHASWGTVRFVALACQLRGAHLTASQPGTPNTDRHIVSVYMPASQSASRVTLSRQTRSATGS